MREEFIHRETRRQRLAAKLMANFEESMKRCHAARYAHAYNKGDYDGRSAEDE
jgi:hypothetical protein